MWSAAVASGDTTYAEYLRACLQQTGLVHSVVEWGVSNRGEWRLRSGEPIPDVVLLGLKGDIEPYFVFAAQLRRIRPTVRIIACSQQQQPDPQLLLRAMRSGVQEFLPPPVNATVLQDALTRFIQEGDAAGAGMIEKLIIVMGSKGGVGTSTVAVNLGVQLVRLTKKRVVLLDFARPVGHVSLLLDLQPRFSIRDAIGNLDRLDGHFFGGLLSRHKTGLEVLAGALHAEVWQQIQVPALVRVVNLAQSTFDFVLMDYGSHFSPEWSSIFRLARVILLVAEANVPALWTLERHLSAAAALGLDAERIRIVINRWNRLDEPALASVEKKLKRHVFARLPNDFRQVSEAVSLGVPLSKNHNNPLMAEFWLLAGKLAGIAPAARVKQSPLTHLLTLRLTR